MVEKKQAKKAKKFLRFLKENNVYHSFFDNFRKQSEWRSKWLNNTLKNYNLKYYKTFDAYLSLINTNDLFRFAFDWSITDSGHMFWRVLNDKWMMKLYEESKLTFFNI